MNIKSSGWLGLPRTKPGWWAVGLAVISVILLFAWSILPGGAWLSFLCGFAGGITALATIVRRQERSWLVFLALLPMAFAVFFILAEFLIPH